MCGISGIFGQKANRANILKMSKILNHRGPDNQDFTIHNEIAISSNRLSIIDLSSKGNMPLKDITKNFEIVFNGEIYNFKELKEKYNLNTVSNTDTEVLLELYKKIDINCLNELNGIYAFAILDKTKNQLFCARDKLGVKPFFFSHLNNELIFSSEIKSIISIIKPEVNEINLINYLSSGIYNHDSSSFFKNINQLLPGQYLIKDKKNFHIKKYWDLEKDENKIENTNVEEEFCELLEDCFKKQLLSDTKLGINVSSGLDSLTMMSILNKINNGQGEITANSYYFNEENIDEKRNLEEFAKKLNWKVNFLLIRPSDIINNAEDVIYSQEQPFPGIITFAKHILIKSNYENSRKVILEAQGGDEIAAGYKYTFPFFIKDLLNEKKFFKAYNEVSKFIKNEKMDYKSFYKFYKNCTNNFFKGKLSADGSSQLKIKINNKTSTTNNFFNLNDNLNNLDRILYNDIFSKKLPRILSSCDKSSMFSSKELRVPLLDHRLVEFCYNTPSNKKINNGNLRDFYRNTVIAKYNLENISKSITKPKKYISDPQTIWLKGDLFDWAYDIMNKNDTFFENYIDKKNLLNEFIKFKKNNFNNSFFFWQILNIELWHERFFKRSTIQN